jgi:hypothetical protein
MFFDPTDEQRLANLEQRLRCAQAVAGVPTLRRTQARGEGGRRSAGRVSFGLGEIAEAVHEILALAILIALIEARRAVGANETSRAAVPRVGP